MTQSNTSIYAIINTIIFIIIFILFIVAFASQPYYSISSTNYIIDIFFTNVNIQVYNQEKQVMIMNKYTNDLFMILILSIIIFVCFGCSFLTLFLNAKKLNKFFNIIILLAMIIIIITFHVSIYNKNSKLSKQLSEITGDKNTRILTTETSGYILTLICMILMFLTIVSSFIF